MNKTLQNLMQVLVIKEKLILQLIKEVKCRNSIKNNQYKIPSENNLTFHKINTKPLEVK